MQFTEKTLSEATSNFSNDNKLGIGGFGTVYKGWINWSYVAVKELTEVCMVL